MTLILDLILKRYTVQPAREEGCVGVCVYGEKGGGGCTCGNRTYAGSKIWSEQ